MKQHGKGARWAFIGALLLLPLLLQAFGDHWVRIADTCLLYVMLALGMNIVVGHAVCWTSATSPSTPSAPTCSRC